jgi:hypothetical protein
MREHRWKSNTPHARALRALCTHCSSQVCGSDFVVRSCPLGLKGVPAFAEFSFDSRPFVETDHLGRPCPDTAQQVRG